MKHFLNLDKITPEFVRENAAKFISCHFRFATGEETYPDAAFYQECLRNGILETSGNIPCKDIKNAATILKILWGETFKLCGIIHSNIELPGKQLVCKNVWSTRGGYADGNFHRVHVTDFYYVA